MPHDRADHDPLEEGAALRSSNRVISTSGCEQAGGIGEAITASI